MRNVHACLLATRKGAAGVVCSLLLMPLFSLMVMLSGSLFSFASAAVTGTCGQPNISMSYYTPVTFAVSPTAAVGSLIGIVKAYPTALINTTTGKPPFYYFASPPTNPVSGITYNGATVYKTNLGGVGLAMWGETYTSGPLSLLSATTTAGTYSGTLNYALIKTAATVSPGTVSISWSTTRGLQCLNTSGVTVKSPSSVVNFDFTYVTITVPACYLSSTSINVPLGDVKRTTFTGVGSTSPAQNFTVPLVCSRATKVSMTLSPGASGAYNASTGIINLDTPTSGKSATGVGIQLLYSNAAKALNTAFSVGSVTAAGNFNVPLSARYYQTATSVTAGQANGTATFTMTYN